MDDFFTTPTARSSSRTQRHNMALVRRNRALKATVAALRARVDQSEVSGRTCAGQLRLLREANEHLVLASFSASDLQAAAELASERQTVFLSMLAHELRNPIAAIAFANAVMRGHQFGSDKLDRLIDIVARQSSQLVRLVDDLLDVARIRTGKLTLQLHEGSLAEIIDGAIATAQPSIDQHEQLIALDLPSCGVRLRADHVRLAQLFSNLLINASKFSPTHSTLHVAAVVQADQVTVTVRDEGKGIEQADMARMFDLFEQGPDEHGHTLSGGLGIGLSLVRAIASLHGGAVSVASAGLGRGSTFTVRLPLATVAPARTHAATAGVEENHKVL